jgi:hypothetical protein
MLKQLLIIPATAVAIATFLFSDHIKEALAANVTILTEKREYLNKDFDKIKLTINNNYDQPIYYVYPFVCHEDEIKINNVWQKIDFAETCKFDPIGMVDTNHKIGKAGSEETFFTRIYNAGLHRIGIHIYVGKVSKETHKLVYSNEFVFKECEVDSDCEFIKKMLSYRPANVGCINNKCVVGR